MGWGLINKKDSLWARTLRHKYGCGDDLIPKMRRKNQNSNLWWLGICKNWNKVLEGSCCRIGNGHHTSFWDDCWTKKGFYLRDAAIIPFEDTDINKKVSNFFLPNGDWNIYELKRVLPEDVGDWIVRTHPDRKDDVEDSMFWSQPKEGAFTVKAAYEMITEADRTDLKRHWRYIWNWPGNQKTRTFMWLCAHNKLLTDKQRKIRKFTNDSSCERCNSSEETVIQAIRDCPLIKDLWRMLIKPGHWSSFFRGDLVDWFGFNHSKAIGKLENLNWQLTFGEAILRIWLNRNA